MTRDFAYILEVLSGGFTTSVRFNDWPAFVSANPQTRIVQDKLNPFLLEGENRLEAAIGPAGGAEGVFELRLYKAKVGTVPTDDATLLFYRWTPTESPLTPAPLTLVVEHRLSVGQAFGRWAWQDATPFAATDAAAIEAQVALLHAALANRDLGTVLGMLEVKLQELARALEQTPQELFAKQRRWLETYFALDDWAMLPLRPLRLEPAADRRAVIVTGDDGESPLRGGGGEYDFELDLTVSHIAGSWRVVR